jgi:hypothetical protein
VKRQETPAGLEKEPDLPASTKASGPESVTLQPDLIPASAFIEALTGKADAPVTFQTFSDQKPDPEPTDWKDPLAKILHGTLSELWDKLVGLNRAGAGIFVMVNEGDFRGRTAENVTGIRAVFTDNEKNDVRPRSLAPSFSVQSARGPHDYWHLGPGTPKEAFRDAQKKLSAFYDSDPGIHDLSRVMRVPGFFHQKHEPIMVTFQPGTGQSHALEEVLAAHPLLEEVPPTSPPLDVRVPAMRLDGTREKKLLDIIREKAEERAWTEGNRHESAKGTAAHARKLGLPDDAVRAIVLEFAKPAGLPELEIAEILRWTLSNVAPDPTEKAPCEEVDEADEEDENERKPSCAAELIEIGRNALLFHDERGDGYAAFTSGSVRRLMKIRGAAFTSELCRLFSERHKFKRAANGEAVAAARHVLEALATFKGEEHRLYTRFARHEGAIYIDMADAAWRAIRITPGRWEIVDTPPLLFRRFPHMRPLPEPVRGGDLSQLFEPFALGDAEKILLTSYVVTIPLGDIPRPLLLPHGPQGSGKTTLLKRIGATIDPTGIDDLDLGGEPRELAQLLDQHAVAFFDNVVKIGDTATRLLCKAATGGGFEKRRLFTDEESVILTFKRVVMISAINVPTTAPDLLDRCLLLPLDRISPEKRLREADLTGEFEAQLPAILGGLLDALAGAMAIYPTLRPKDLPRMADFATWGAAVTEALGLTLKVEKGETLRGAKAFLHAYNENVSRQTEEVLEADPVARAVRDFAHEEKTWRGTASELFADLKAKHEDEMKGKDSGWPQRSDGLARRLRVLASTLAEEGVAVRWTREGKSRTRIISLTVKTADGASAPSAASAEAQLSPPGADSSGLPRGDGVLQGVRPDPAARAVGGRADATDTSSPLSTAHEEQVPS